MSAKTKQVKELCEKASLLSEEAQYSSTLANCLKGHIDSKVALVEARMVAESMRAEFERNVHLSHVQVQEATSDAALAFVLSDVENDSWTPTERPQINLPETGSDSSTPVKQTPAKKVRAAKK